MESLEFGRYLRELRKKKGMTLEVLGKAAGMSHSFLSQIETGKRGIPTPEQLYRLCKPLDVSHAQLMINAGHMKWDSEIEPLETDYERDVYETNLQIAIDQKNEEHRQANLHINDLVTILKNPKTNYKGRPLSDLDRERILSMLEIIVTNGGAIEVRKIEHS